MQIIDTHVHYNLDPLFTDWQTHWKKAQTEHVGASIVIGTDLTTSQRALEIAATTPALTAALAIHPGEFTGLLSHHSQDKPIYTQEFSQEYVNDLLVKLELLAEADGALTHISAIGETGLDYFHQKTLPSKQQAVDQFMQKTSLEAHFHLAKKLSLPILLHVRDQEEQAYWDVLEIMDKTKYDGQFVLHCVSGPTAYIQEATKRGGYISFAGNVTYPSAGHLRDIAKLAPPDRILIETDAPFLPPVPHRGKLCEPWMIRLTAEYLEKELGVSLEQCVQNSLKLFPKLAPKLYTET